MAKKENDLNSLIAVKSSEYISELWTNYQNATQEFRKRLIDFYKQYRGIPNRKNYDGLANVFINETLEACESITAQEVQNLFPESRFLMLRGMEETDEQKAKLNEELMQFYLEKINHKSKLTRQIRQKNKYGTTFAKVFWNWSEKDVAERGTMGQTVRKVVANHPDYQYIDLLDLAVDPGKPDIPNMDWVIWRKRLTIDDIKEKARRGLYSQVQVDKLDRGKGTGANDYAHNKKDRFQSIGINYQMFDKDDFEVLEFWGIVPRWWVDEEVDIKSDEAGEMVQAVAEVVLNGPTLRLERNPYWHQEIPFVMGHYVQVDDETFGMGVCEICESLQQELNDKRNQSLDHATEQIAPPLIINKNANIEDSQIQIRPRQKIYSDVQGTAAISPMALGGNYQENTVMDGIIKQDIRNATGATNPVQGIQSSKESTAFETNVLQQRGSARINVSTVDFSEKFIKRLYRLMWSMIPQFVDTKQVIRILGKDGAKWEEVTPDDIIINADLVPRISTDVDNRQIVRAQMIQFVTQIASFYPRMNIYRLIKRTYEMFPFGDADEVIPKPESEMGQNDLSMEQEIQVLSQGQKIEVKFYENHMEKLSALMAFKQESGGQLTPQAQAALDDKIRQHMGYLQALEVAQQAQMAGGAAGEQAGQPMQRGQRGAGRGGGQGRPEQESAPMMAGITRPGGV